MREPFERWREHSRRHECGFTRGFGRGEGMEGGHFRGWRGGRGGGRPFDHGELRLVILALIAEKPSHGYELIKAIEDRFGGAYSPSPGVVYPTLTMLEELGHATVQEAGGKKLYTITDQGRAFLATNKTATDAAMGRMGHAAGAWGLLGHAPRLIRAMHNLKTALRLRYRSGPLNEEQVKTIVEALDHAASLIERA